MHCASVGAAYLIACCPNDDAFNRARVAVPSSIAFASTAFARTARTALCGIALTGAVSAPVRAAEPQAGEMRLAYAFHLGGVRILDAAARLTYGDGRYMIGLNAQTDGFLGQVASWKTDVTAHGRLAPGGLPRPESFRSVSMWRDKPRNTTVEYTPDGTPTVTLAEPPPTQDREPVPDNLKPGTVDPMTAVVAALHAAREGRGCGGKIPVYDGRQRFDLVWNMKGEETLPPSDLSAFSGKAIACDLDFQPVAGRWKQDRPRRDRDEEGRRRSRDVPVTIWLAQAAPDTAPVPVRMEAETNLGKLVVHLAKVDVLPKSAAAGQAPGGTLAASR